MGTVHFISRRARLVFCVRCQAPTLVGIDEGLPYIADPLPLTPEGELVAALQGRPTFSWYMGYATFRSESRIRRHPRATVLAKHRCGNGLLAYIDVSRAELMARVIGLLRSHNKVSDNAADQDALIAIADILGGRVFAQTDDERAPF